MDEYKKFDEQAWRNFGENILKKKGSESQAKFLQACQNGKDDFLQYVHGSHFLRDSIIGTQKVSVEHKFAEREFVKPPEDTQKIIWDTFSHLPNEETTSCGFWGHIVITMIDDDILKPEYLAASLNGDTNKGAYVIDKAIKSQDEKTTDDCARRILRSMCNPAARGKRIIFNDFYLAKSYWRWNWATRMSQHIELDFEHILKIFDETLYAEFYGKMHSGRSYISSENTLGGLLLFLSQETIAKKNHGKVIDRLSYLSTWKAIEIQEPNLNKKEIQEIAKNL